MASRASLWLLFALYAGFCLFCVWGFPPPVDLPAHGAELQTLVDLLRGQSDVAQSYRLSFPIGYGLATWLAIPVAFVTDGAFAVRFMLWLTLLLFPLSLWALLRAFGRSPAMVVLGLPLSFNISYWYGLLSGLFAQPLLFFSVASFERVLTDETKRVRKLVVLNLLAVGVMLSHLLAFAILVFLLAVRALVSPKRLAAIRLLAMGLSLPVVVSIPKALQLAERAVVPGESPPTEYAAASHLNWFFKNYVPEGKLGVVVPLVIAVVLLGLYLVRRREEPLAPFALFLSMALLYAVTPKTLSGIFLVSTRLPVLVGGLSLLLVDARSVRRPLFALLSLGVLATLIQVGVFHARFRAETAGLAELIPEGRRPRHGYVSLVGSEILGSKQIYLQHVGQWVTATRGGVGHDFFADAEHHTVRFIPGQELPVSLLAAPAPLRDTFQEIYVFGEGPLPEALAGWREVARVGRWRRIARP